PPTHSHVTDGYWLAARQFFTITSGKATGLGVRMPTMPFHLEKGAVLGALDDLLNANSDPLETHLRNAYAVLMSPTKPNDILAALGAMPAPTGPAAPSLADALQQWFQTGTDEYWKGYDPEFVLQVASEGLRFALRQAWGDNGTVLPTMRDRRVHTWWYCVQPWFDTWITWEHETAPVNVIFSTPSHHGGTMITDMANAVVGANPMATALGAGDYGDATGDMVLVGMERHKQRWEWVNTDISGKGEWKWPQRIWNDFGDGPNPEPGRWSIRVPGGGMQPKTKWT
ncbi:MAG: hypothetical protein AAFY28_17865, partial [Actinomycetota bacterium]